MGLDDATLIEAMKAKRWEMHMTVKDFIALAGISHTVWFDTVNGRCAPVGLAFRHRAENFLREHGMPQPREEKAS